MLNRIKRIIIILAAAVILVESPCVAYAAVADVIQSDNTKTIIIGNKKFAPLTLKDLFDANYYLMLYPELRAVYGDNAELLYQHFVKYGLSEGRKCSPYLDLSKYIAGNADLSSVFGTNIDAIVAHYFIYGVNEGRNSYATPLDLAIQQKLETASNVYSNGKLDNDAIKALYGQAYLETAYIQNSRPASSNSDDVSNSDENSHIIISNDVIAVPWDYVENGYVTLDMIKAHCGDNLILVQNSKNDVTFIAGDISSRNVTDSNSVMEAVQSFFGILKYPEDTCYLHLTKEYYDSSGNHIYKFESRDIETDITTNKILDICLDSEKGLGAVTGTVFLKTDKNGNIIAVSSTSKDTFEAFDYSTYSIMEDNITDCGVTKCKITDKRWNVEKLTVDQISSILRKSKEYEVLSNLPEEYNVAYDRSYPFYKFFVQKDDAIYMICVSSEQEINSDQLICSIYPIDKVVYYSTEIPGEKSQPYDNLYSNVEVTYMSFTDSNGRMVSLPVASDETGYYFCAPEYKLILKNDTDYADTKWINNDSGLYYIDLGNPDENAVTIFSNMYESCKACYEHSGKNNVLPTIISLYSSNSSEQNAFGTSDFALSLMLYTNYKPYIADISTAGHESTHAYTKENYSWPHTSVKFVGAISEGYADIVGMIIQQKVIEEYLQSTSEKTGKSIDEVYQEILNQKKWLIDRNDWYSGGGYDENGNPIWLYKASDPVGTCNEFPLYADKIGGTNFVTDGNDDDYGCHANSSVLSHITYEMWNSGVEKDYDKLFDIWYDTVYVMTGESSFYDIRNYIEASMKEKNYSHDQIDKTMELFDAANITKETQDYLKVYDNYNPEHYYTKEYIDQTGVKPEINIDNIQAPLLNNTESNTDSTEKGLTEEELGEEGDTNEFDAARAVQNDQTDELDITNDDTTKESVRH